MSLATITVPRDYGYVLLATAGTVFLGLWHGMRVTGFRKPASMPYPAAYASTYDIQSASSPETKKAMYLFNCAQRAHGNYLENHAAFVMGMLIAGLGWPRTSAGLGVVWMACRVVYALGYTRADKEKGQGRLVGSGFWLCQFAVYGMSAWQAWAMCP